MRAFVGVVIVVGFICLPAQAAVLYVGPGEAYSTIQAGIDAAADGDVIIVRDGTYTGTGNRDIDFKGKAIHLKSEKGPERCIVDAWGNTYYTFRCFIFWSGEGADSILEGFTIRGGYAAQGAGIDCYRSSPTILNNVVTENVGDGPPRGGGGMCVMDGSPMICGNTFLNNTGPGSGASGLHVTGASSAFVIGNTFSTDRVGQEELHIETTSGVGTVTGNVICGRGNGIYARSWGNSAILLLNNIIAHNDGYGVECTGGDITIINSTIVGNENSAIYCVGGRTTIANSIFWGNDRHNPDMVQVFFSAGDMSVSYSDVQGGIGGMEVPPPFANLDWGFGNINTDPLFADPANGDYHLKSKYGRWDPKANNGVGGWVTDDVTSPCINAGDPASDYGPEPEPNGGRANMGAYGNTPEASKGKWILPGDANHDSTVNVLDLIVIRNLFMHDAGSGDNWRGDVNEDGRINVLDLIFTRNRLGAMRE